MRPRLICCPVLVLALATAGWTAPAPADAFGPVLKRRVTVVTTEPAIGAGEFSARITAQSGTDRLRADLRREIMTGPDLLKSALSTTRKFRIIEPVPGSDPGNGADLLLHLALALEEGAQPWRVTLRAVEPGSRIVRGVFTGEASDLREAIDAAVGSMGRELALSAVVLEVTQAAANGGVVTRGLDDGLRIDTRLAGFRPGTDAAKTGDREVALITSTPLGEYEVASVRAGVSIWRPVGTAPPLAPGDLLEVPEFRLRRPEESTRARDMQDAIFKK